MTTNTTERAREFMRYFHSEYGWFEQMTGIVASKWRDLDRGKTKEITAAMIDAFGQTWPEYILWLTTGLASSPRGQCTPQDYFDLTYGTVRVLEPSPRRFWRDLAGVLCPGELLTRHKESSVEHEVEIAAGALYLSAVANEQEAKHLAKRFHADILKGIKPGKEVVLSPRELKQWINQFALPTQ